MTVSSTDRSSVMEDVIHSRRQFNSRVVFAVLSLALPFLPQSAMARSDGGRGGGRGKGGNAGGNGRGGGSDGESKGNDKAGEGKGSDKGDNTSGDGDTGGDKGSPGSGAPGADAPDTGDKGRKSGPETSDGDDTAPTDASSGQNPKADVVKGDTARVDSRGISVKHRSGIAEEVNNRGRYVMRDNRGRTIVNRAATSSDLDRLRSFID